MTDDRLPLAELLQKAGDGDFLRSVAEAVLQLLMEADGACREFRVWAGMMGAKEPRHAATQRAYYS